MKELFIEKRLGFTWALLSVLYFLVSTLALGQVVPPAPALTNCQNPGLGFNNFPAAVTIGNQIISITKTINTGVYSMSPGSSKCSITIRPGSLLFFPGTSKIGGSITFTFSEPVSNIQIALVTQNSLPDNQLIITTAHGETPVFPVLTVFNSSADDCSGVYEVSGNIIHTKSNPGSSATMVNIGGSYFTSVTLKNTSSNDTREWIDLRLCNAVIGCLPPVTPTLDIYEKSSGGNPNASFVITNYKASNTYTITPSKDVSQKNRIITAPRGTSYVVKATSGNCLSVESAISLP